MTFCKDCRYWSERASGDEPEWHYCEHPKARSDLTGREDGFGVVEGEPFNGGSLATGPFFFCRHGEPRPYHYPPDEPCRVLTCPVCQTKFQAPFDPPRDPPTP